MVVVTKSHFQQAQGKVTCKLAARVLLTSGLFFLLYFLLLLSGRPISYAAYQSLNEESQLLSEEDIDKVTGYIYFTFFNVLGMSFFSLKGTATHFSLKAVRGNSFV